MLCTRTRSGRIRSITANVMISALTSNELLYYIYLFTSIIFLPVSRVARLVTRLLPLALAVRAINHNRHKSNLALLHGIQRNAIRERYLSFSASISILPSQINNRTSIRVFLCFFFFFVQETTNLKPKKSFVSIASCLVFRSSSAFGGNCSYRCTRRF